MLLPRANAARHDFRATATLLFTLALAAAGSGCVDVTPPWSKAEWSNRDAGPSTLPEGEPGAPDSAVIDPNTDQAISPEPSPDAEDNRPDSPDQLDAREDVRFVLLNPDSSAQTPDTHPDATPDTGKIEGADALVKRDQSPGLDTLDPDTSSVAPDALPPDALPPDALPPANDTRPEALPPQGLVAYYPCESARGSVLADMSGNMQDATLANGSGGSTPVGFSFGPGKVGNGVRLNPNDKAFVSLPKGIVSKMSQVTIATWVKVNVNTAFQRIFDFGLDTNTFMYLTNSGSTGVRFRISSSTGKNQVVEADKPLTAGIWTHIALTLGDDGISIFVDGNQVAQKAPAILRASDLGDTGNNYLGRSQFSADPYLDGSLDEFRIYDRVLSTAEIADLASGR